MIIHNFNIRRTVLRSAKADALLLVVDTNAVLANAIFLQSFKLVIWRDTQMVKVSSGIEHPQFSLYYVQ